MSAALGLQVPAYQMQVELHPLSLRQDPAVLKSLDLFGDGVALSFSGTDQQLADLARRITDTLRKAGIDV